MRKALAAWAGIALVAPIALASAAPRATTDQPVYFPHTGSHYELIEIGPGYSVRGQAPEIKWERAEKWAMTRLHKGARGRLAVVKDAETMEFLRETFKPSHKAWIGLRYFCRLNRLLWTDGNEHPTTSYRPWTQPWRSPDSCRNGSSTTEYAPVFIGGLQEGFRWQAHGQSKEFNYLFVEYPTGKP
jgi:hypothetical protein